MDTLDTSSWDELCARMVERALSGDAAAIRFCEKHRPGNGLGTAPDNITDLLTPTERKRFEWCIGHNQQTPSDALLDCMASTYFDLFTREELRAWSDHLDNRQNTPAALPQEQADALARALALALKRDQQPEEIRHNKWLREMKSMRDGLDGEKTV